MRKFGRIVFHILCLCLLVFCTAGLIPRAYAASAMTASESCVEFIKEVEGFSPQPYYDYNQYTVGYGTKCPTEKYFDYRANGIPRSEAEALLREAVAGIEDTLNQKLIDRYQLTLNQHQFDALVSFSYNLGTSWVTYDSSLRNALLRNAGEDEMVYAFSLYCTAGGKYLPGLVTRRLCEANIYLNGVYSKQVSDAYGYVYYDANGGTLTYRVQGYVCDNGAMPAASAARDNDIFLGWFTNVTGGAQVSILDSTVRGRTLFARWQSSENPSDETLNSTTVKVTGDVVNVRSGPGTNYSIVRKSYQNEVLTVSHVSHITSMKWGNIQDGWICLDYTNYEAVINGTDQPGSESDPGSSENIGETDNGNPPVNTDTPENAVLLSGIVTVNDALRIRSGPGTNYSVVGFLFNGKEVDILEQESDGSMVWGRISKGWVSMDYIITDTIQGDIPPAPEQVPEQQPEEKPEQETEPQPPQETEQAPIEVPVPQPGQEPSGSGTNTESVFLNGTVKADALRIRAGAGTDYRIVGFYYQNNAVVITEKILVDSVYWGKTDKGWINLDYVLTDSVSEETVQPAEGTRMTVIGDCLRVRKGTGTNYRISQLLYYGDSVIVYETVTVEGTVWGRVENGWICMDYVK